MKRLLPSSFIILIALATGCTTVNRPPPTKYKGAAWPTVLEESVNAQGQIDFEALRKDGQALYTAAYEVAEADPWHLKTPSSRLTFYINGYNILAMYHAVSSGWEPRQKVRFFLLSKLPIARQEVSLFNLENKIIRPLGEPRIHFALNCMVRGCPRLPQQPFAEEILDAQLDDAAREFLRSEKHVRVDSSKQQVHLSKIMKWYRKDFESEGQSLLDYVNLYRDEKIPADYTITWLPYDWTLNQR